MAAEIRLFTCLNDNFGYLVHDPATGATASVDAPEAAPIIAAKLPPDLARMIVDEGRRLQERVHALRAWRNKSEHAF